MRLLVQGGGLTSDRRMAMAAYGLALRGHEVRWLGPGIPDGAGAPAPEALSPATRAREARGVDLVLGGGSPWAVAVSGWAAGAFGMVLSVTRADARRWNMAQRFAWESLPSLAMEEEGPDDGDAVDGDADAATRHVAWSREPVPETPDATHPDVDRLERAAERLLARRRGHAPRPAVFLDRDGTLVVERGYLAHAEDLELLPGVPDALRQLHAAGYALVVVSNQSGVGRGLFPLSRVYEAMARLRARLRASGVELDAIYFCPHRPDAGCACRKPGTELLRNAARELRLSLPASAMVGDKLLDAETGQRAGALGVLVRTGYGRDEERRVTPEAGERPPDRIADSLTAAAAWLVDRAPGVTGH